MTRPFKVSALADGTVGVDKPVTIDCSMIPALEAWLADVVQPYAEARFGADVVGLEAFGAYSCRGVDNVPGAQLSEHAFGNAIDVSGFRLADGREISIVRDWKRAGSQEVGVPARGPRRRLPALHHRARPRRRRIPLQSFPSRPGDARRDQHRPAPLLPAAASAGPHAAARPPRRPAAGAGDRGADGRRPATLRPSAGPLDLRGPSGALPPALQAYDARPAPPPILPAEDGVGVDGEPTSSIPLSRDD